ncbi:hypothetical protein CYY_007122, partial [Polysphondylium violaceum]
DFPDFPSDFPKPSFPPGWMKAKEEKTN